MANGSKAGRIELDRAELVGAAVEKSREQWLNLALRITRDVQDAEDAVQEAIAKVLGGFGDITDVSTAGRYLTRSVSTCAVDRVRARSFLVSFATGPGDAGPRPTTVPPDQEERLLAAEERKKRSHQLKVALAGLPELDEPRRQVIELVLLREPPLKLREAAELLEIPLTTLHARLKSALRSLRKKISENPPLDR